MFVKSKGPYSRGGPIGKMLDKYESLPIVSSQTIDINYNLETVIYNLSTDLKCLREIILPIMK